MRVEILTNVLIAVSPDIVYQGDTVDLPNDLALNLIASGLARMVVGVIETAVRKPMRRTVCKITQRLDVRNLHHQQPNP